MRKRFLIASMLGCLMMGGCFDSYCDNLYTESEVWLANGTMERMYYAYSDTPYLTPECITRPLPVMLANVTDFKRFSPMQVMANPTYTPNGHRGDGDTYGYYPYLLILRYDNTVVACYDISRAAMAKADYPWFSPVPDSTDICRVEIAACHDFETNYKYMYYLTNNVL